MPNRPSTSLGLFSVLLWSACSPPPSDPSEVVDAFVAAVDAGDSGAVSDLVDDGLIQHSARTGSGKQGLLDSVESLSSEQVDEHRRVVDGSRVAVHSTRTLADGSQHAAFDVFRVQDGQVVEHWDALQPLIPASETVSGNGMTDGPGAPDLSVDTDASRQVVVDFVDLVLTQGQFDQLTTYVSTEQYIQHNPLADDGIEGLVALVQALDAQGLTFFYTSTPLVVAQGDMVLVGSEGVFGPPELAPLGIFYDLFRVEDGVIVEHWDVLPPSPDASSLPHDNGFF